MEESLKITEGDKQKVTSIVQFLETMNDFEALCLLYTWVGVPPFIKALPQGLSASPR